MYSDLQLRSRRRDAIELAGIYGLILVVIWTPRPYQWPLWGLTVVLILTLIGKNYEGLAPMGFCTRNLCQSSWGVVLSIALAVFSIWLAVRLHTLHLPTTTWSCIQHYGGYAIWAGMQQVLLQCFFLSRTLRLVSNATLAAALSACLFAAAHLPNPLLTAITLIAGLASCLFFLRYKNLWPLAIAHAILGIAIAITVPGRMDHNMRVGISYLTWVERPVIANTVANPAMK
jgi:membrane protease YdiL (CAAX protease family)